MKKFTCQHLLLLSLFTSLGLLSNATTDPSPITGPAFVCYNQSGTVYEVTNIPGATFNWNVTGGGVITSVNGTNSITIDWGTTFGDVCVTADDGSGVSNPSCLAVQYANDRPTLPDTIFGAQNTLCPSQIVTYSVPLDLLATTYDWIVPANTTILSGQGTNTIELLVQPFFNWGYLRVSAINCRGTRGQKAITLFSKPVTPGPIAGPQVGACAGNTYTYSITPVNGATSYTWIAPEGCLISTPAASGNPLTSSATTVSVTFSSSFTVGDLSVVSNSGCGSSNPRVWRIRSVPMRPGAISGLQYGLCDLANVPYSIAPLAGATSYTWTLTPSSAGTIVGNGNSITVNFTGSFTVANLCVVASNDCGNSIERCMRIFAMPQRPGPIEGPIGACNSNPSISIAYYEIDPVFGASDYTWTVPLGATIINGQGTNEITVDFLGGTTGDVVVTANNICGISIPRKLNVIVNGCRIGSMSSISIDAIRAFPNPAHDQISLSLTSGTDQAINIVILDVAGRKVQSFQKSCVVGSNVIEMPLANLEKGIYFIQIIMEGRSEKVMFVKD